MLTKTQHLFDDATRITPGDSRWQGRTTPLTVPSVPRVGLAPTVVTVPKVPIPGRPVLTS